MILMRLYNELKKVQLFSKNWTKFELYTKYLSVIKFSKADVPFIFNFYVNIEILSIITFSAKTVEK